MATSPPPPRGSPWHATEEYARLLRRRFTGLSWTDARAHAGSRKARGGKKSRKRSGKAKA